MIESTSTTSQADRDAGNPSRLIDPTTLMRIKSLQLRAKVVVEGMWSGLHRSPYHGFSAEFTEYRQYTAGDDLRYMDWRLFARSDRYYIKRFEDETSLRCHLLVDASPSMTYGGPPVGSYSKSEYANTLAATLAHFLNRQRDAVGLVTFDESLKDYVPARHRPGHLHRIMVALDRPRVGKHTDLLAPLQRVADLVTKRGVMVLISDLLAPLEGLRTHLGYLRSRGHEVFIFHVLDPTELTLDLDDPVIFEDMENGKDLYVDPVLMRKQYVERFTQHLAEIEAISDALGIEYRRMTTDQPLELALFEFLRSRLEEGKKVMRHGAAGAAGIEGGRR